MANEPSPFILTDQSPIVKKMRTILGVPSVLGVLAITAMAIQSRLQNQDKVNANE